jgi:hypothetical protein
MDKLLDEFDETEVFLQKRQPPANRDRTYFASEPGAKELHERDESVRKSRLNEVPTFLV